MRFVQRGGIGDPLAALFRGEGIHAQMGGADQTLISCSRSLDGHHLIQQGLVKTAPKLRQGFR